MASRSLFAGLLVVSAFSALSAVGCGSSEPSEAGAGSADLSEAALPTLRVPVLAYYDDTLLSALNDELRAAGLGTFPDTIDVEFQDGKPTQASLDQWEAASALAEDAAERLNRDIEMRDWGEPYSYQTNNPATGLCYRGDGAKVKDAVQALAGWDVFSEQLLIHGWAYKHSKNLDESLDESATEYFPSIWQEWRGDGEAVLFITASSDDGDETNPGLVYECR